MSSGLAGLRRGGAMVSAGSWHTAQGAPTLHVAMTQLGVWSQSAATVLTRSMLDSIRLPLHRKKR